MKERNIFVKGLKYSVSAAIAVSGMVASTAPPKETDPPPNISYYTTESSSKIPRNSIIDTLIKENTNPVPLSQAQSLGPDLVEIWSNVKEDIESTTENIQLAQVLIKMEEKPDRFSKDDLEDVRMYYPIYKAVAERYGLKWYLLWIIHRDESNASRNPNAFNGQSFPHMGAMQIGEDNYKKLHLEIATDGIKNLDKLKQLNVRHPERDLQDIAEAGKIFRYEMDIYKKRNYRYKEDLAVKYGFERYSNPTGGDLRYFNQYLPDEKIFK